MKFLMKQRQLEKLLVNSRKQQVNSDQVQRNSTSIPQPRQQLARQQHKRTTYQGASNLELFLSFP
jgi:hypothetical protein